MTISELGSLGEIVGSIAVLITLIILVFQVRGARIELSSQMTREIKRNNNETFHQLTRRPDLVDTHIRGQREYDSLSEAERLTWQIWLFTWITQTEDAWMARSRGIPNMEWVNIYVLGVALVLRSEGGQTVWLRLRPMFEKSFADAMERTVSCRTIEAAEMPAFAKFQNRIAVLTGSASGIGLELMLLMLQLVRRGAHVAVCDVDRERMEASVQRARKINPDVRVTAHLHDVSNEKSVVRFVKEVAKEHGTDAIHLLINNPRVVGGGSFVVEPRDEWERTFAVSWFGTYYCTRAFSRCS